jgi:hypothetical protein
MNDLDIKTLINSAVDAELAGHRTAPPFDRTALADRPGPAHALRLWSAPLLAASVAVLLAVGAMLGITLSRDRNHVSHPAAPSPSPSSSLSISRSANPDLEAAQRAYAEAMASAQEATEVAGVSVGPLTAKDAARLKGTGLFTGDTSGITSPAPGKTYSFTLSYLAGPSDESDDPPGVLTSEVRDVASGSCAEPFLVRPGHAYRIQCQAMLLDGVTGKGTLTLRTPTGLTSGSMNLTDPAQYPASPSASASPGQAEAARKYSAALASAPEASAVAGVTDRAATAEERQRNGETVGGVNAPVPSPQRGKSYPVTLIYIPGSDAPTISVLAIKLEDVAAGRCPSPFRIRRGHAYQIHCQVTFRAGADGQAYYQVTEPHRVATSGMNLSYR